MDEAAVRKITLNGEPVETTAKTLEELVVKSGFGDARVATALNGAFVAAGQRRQAVINAGDKIEVLSARQGG